ncbi:MAG: adenylate/guanylate cyclase domain-containing protein [candidate division WOR-3 bacterium]|nr:MAG: adenylate/guanylate cyclase domain-containing protein [candidate division WOR-3 bacterium]
MKCSRCGEEIERLVHFCPWCGMFCGDQKSIPFEDMNLTFLRADLSGFTEMSETMIAEDVMAFLNEVFGFFSKIIERNKGTIYQIIGDEIVSIFGLPKGSTFAPHMAIFAAEEMFHRLFECNKKEYLKNPIGLKIGVETEYASIFNVGESVQSSLHNAMIITLGFKKSQILQKNAENNTILVGECLYQATKAFFEYREVGEFLEHDLSVKAYEYKLKLKT